MAVGQGRYAFLYRRRLEMSYSYGGEKKVLNSNERQPVKPFAEQSKEQDRELYAEMKPEHVKARYRQGNVLLETVEEIPETARRIQTNIVKEDRTHRHVVKTGKIYDYNMEFLLNGRNVVVTKFLWLEHDTILSHDEHNELHLPAGKYAVFEEVRTDKEDVKRALRERDEREQEARQQSANAVKFVRD